MINKNSIKPALVLVLCSLFFDIRPAPAGPVDPVRVTRKTESLQSPAGPGSSYNLRADPAPLITLVFTGDMTLGRCVAQASIRMADYTYPFHLVAGRLKQADLTIGSLDGTLSDETDPMPCPQANNLIGPTRMVEGLLSAGYDAVTVATNHILDCGSKGFECDHRAFRDTLKTLEDSGIQPLGGGETLVEARRPVTFTVKGTRFAFLAVDAIDARVWAGVNRPGVAPLSVESLDLIKADIAAAKDLADVVIVLPHWGVEYAGEPEEIQREWAAEFVAAGATLVVGNHPHRIQPVEVLPAGAVYYSLGNFVFDQDQDYRRQGIALVATFRGSELVNQSLMPVMINYFTYQPFWAEGDEAAAILSRAYQLDR